MGTKLLTNPLYSITYRYVVLFVFLKKIPPRTHLSKIYFNLLVVEKANVFKFKRFTNNAKYLMPKMCTF